MQQVEVGEILEGKVTGLTNFGAFVELPNGSVGMVHISEVAPTYVKEIRDFVTENQEVKVKVLTVGADGKISLSMKQAMPRPTTPQPPQRRGPRPSGGRGGHVRTFSGGFDPNKKASEASGGSFEDMMAKFKQMSDEKISDLKRSTESKHGGFSRRGGGNKPGDA